MQLLIQSYCAGHDNYNAETLETGPKDYSVAGTSADKAFNALGSLGTMAFAYNTVILPEIQVSTAHLALQMSRSEVRNVSETFEVCMVMVIVPWSNAVMCRMSYIDLLDRHTALQCMA